MPAENHETRVFTGPLNSIKEPVPTRKTIRLANHPIDINLYIDDELELEQGDEIAVVATRVSEGQGMSYACNNLTRNQSAKSNSVSGTRFRVIAAAGGGLVAATAMWGGEGGLLGYIGGALILLMGSYGMSVSQRLNSLIQHHSQMLSDHSGSS